MNQIDIKGLHFSYTEKEEILKGINLVIDESSYCHHRAEWGWKDYLC
ncbi:MAG: hypothetical protein ACLR0U_03825 [Enterocloster clostridioformis]